MKKPSLLEYILIGIGLTIVIVLALTGIVAILFGVIYATYWFVGLGVVGIIIECIIVVALFVLGWVVSQYLKDLKKYNDSTK